MSMSMQQSTSLASPHPQTRSTSLKGKERAYPDLVTYRALLGNLGGPLNPLRCVSHIDIDAAYASMEMARLGLDPSVPLAVQQWDGLIAVNYAARAFGITRMESPAEALKKCPHIHLVHCAVYREGDTEPGYHEGAKPATHKISLDYYRRESTKIIQIFSTFCPVVEKASIDESYLDLSLPVKDVLLSRYPYLATIPLGATLDTPLPSPHSKGVTLDWTKAGNVIPPSPEDHEAGDAKESDHASKEENAEDLTWSDVALYCAAEIVAACRKAVQEQLGYTCSAGIAPNKMLAKLCSGWKKPDAQTVLRFAAISGFLEPIKFTKIRNLGGKLGTLVRETYEAETVGDLLKVNLSELQNRLGEDQGMWVWEIIRGLDMTEVETKTNVKSMISSKNFRPAIYKYKEAAHWIHVLAIELHLRLVDARANSPSLWPKTITLQHRSDKYVIRSHQIPFPFTTRLDIPYIDKSATKLLRSVMGDNTKYEDDSPIGPYSNLQLSLSGLERLEKGQEGIERFFSGSHSTNTPASGSGLSRVSPPPLSGPIAKREATTELNQPKKKKKLEVIKSVFAELQPSKKGKEKEPKKIQQTRTFSKSDVIDLTTDSDDDPPSQTFTCPQCKKVLPVSSSDAGALQRLKAEHEDYHFARSMVEKERFSQREQPKSILEPRDGEHKKKNGGTGGGQTGNGQQSLTGFFNKS